MTDPTLLPPIDHCRSCGAEIRWVTTPAGKAMPLDAKSEKRWVVRFEMQGRERPDLLVEVTPTWKGEMVDTYESHYATCPQAARWRGKKREER